MNKKFDDAGYLVVRQFIPQELCQFAKAYFKIRNDSLDYTIDPQCPLSKSFYGDTFCETLMLTSTKKLSEITELQLLPTYSYTRIYAKGDVLKIHTDRPACQYSATLCLGRPKEEEISAIYMSKNDDGSKASELFLEEGDLCIYKGMDMYHWRKPFTQSWYLQTFLHYVDGNDKYANYIFDGRRSLGIKNKE